MDTRGYMTRFFDGVVIKKLSAVEALKAQSSNQHELNATLPIQEVFGRPVDLEKIYIPTRFYYLSDEERLIPELGEMCQKMLELDLLLPQAMLVLEHRTGVELHMPDVFALEKERTYGETQIHFYRLEDEHES